MAIPITSPKNVGEMKTVLNKLDDNLDIGIYKSLTAESIDFDCKFVLVGGKPTLLLVPKE